MPEERTWLGTLGISVSFESSTGEEGAHAEAPRREGGWRVEAGAGIS